jgi:hypothetical protein
MAKNPRRQQQESAASKPSAVSSGASISLRGRKVIGIGVACVILGFIILTRTDPAGQNWASTLSPALLVLGYTLIGVGIVLPDRSAAENIPLNPPQSGPQAQK